MDCALIYQLVSQRVYQLVGGYEADNLVPNFILEILNKEYQQPELEPLIVGLRIFFGEDRPLVSQEIFEIGKDIADRIRTKQAEIANSPPRDQKI